MNHFYRKRLVFIAMFGLMAGCAPPAAYQFGQPYYQSRPVMPYGGYNSAPYSVPVPVMPQPFYGHEEHEFREHEFGGFGGYRRFDRD